MDYIWTPWRYAYLTDAANQQRKGVPEVLRAWPGDLGCVFCNLLASTQFAIENGMNSRDADRVAAIVFRARHSFICLNRFPYTSGHLMILPYRHEGSLAALEEPVAFEIMTLAQKAERAFNSVYHPDGLNMGLNLGEAAGAGVAGHLHLHMLPRWRGDANFMTTVAETRVLPETLETTWETLQAAFSAI